LAFWGTGWSRGRGAGRRRRCQRFQTRAIDAYGIFTDVTDDDGTSATSESQRGGATASTTEPGGDAGGVSPAVDSKAGARPFATWWTILATILLAGGTVASVAERRGMWLQMGSADPLAAFDATIQLEGTEPPLRPQVAADAEHAMLGLIQEAH